MKNNKWEFLTSPSFYAMVIMALAMWLFTDGYITAGLRDFLVTIGGGFVVKRTVDKAIDKVADRQDSQQVKNM